MITRIEEQAMNAVISINHKLRDQNEPDWEQRRYETARDLLAAFMINPPEEVFNIQGDKGMNTVEFSVYLADSLIKTLKEKGGE